MKKRPETRNPKPETRNKGFSIIELSIVLSILALVATTALTSTAGRIEQRRINVTKERMAVIMDAIEKYAEANNYLPCPSDNTLDYRSTVGRFGTNLTTGQEPDADGDGFCLRGPPAINLALINDSFDVPLVGGATIQHRVVLGGVPVADLGIGPEYAVDGWSRRFSYVVDDQLTWSGVAATPAANDGGWDDEVGEIEIRGISGLTLTNNAAMVLISHGRNGYGAWPAEGGTTQIDNTSGGCNVTTHPDEIENTNLATTTGFNTATPAGGLTGQCDGTTGFPAFDNIFVQKFQVNSTTEVFDDIVEFRTKWQLD